MTTLTMFITYNRLGDNLGPRTEEWELENHTIAEFEADPSVFPSALLGEDVIVFSIVLFEDLPSSCKRIAFSGESNAGTIFADPEVRVWH